jgi:hypothetical protein
MESVGGTRERLVADGVRAGERVNCLLSLLNSEILLLRGPNCNLTLSGEYKSAISLPKGKAALSLATDKDCMREWMIAHEATD